MRTQLTIALFAVGMIGCQTQPTSRSVFHEVDLRIPPLVMSLPANFTEMPDHEIQARFRYPMRPKHVYWDRARTKWIAINIQNVNVTDIDTPLEEVKKGLTQMVQNQLPDLRWVSNRITDLHEIQWIDLEYTLSEPVPQHNRAIFLIQRTHAIGITFTAKERDWESTRLLFDDVIATVRIVD